MLTDWRLDSLALGAAEHSCQTTTGCDEVATVMVWCDHHVLGCDYTGFRCDVHFNLLHLETVREVDSVRRNWLTLCDRCGKRILAGLVSDHLRWIHL